MSNTINSNFYNSNGLFGSVTTSLPDTSNAKKSNVYGDYKTFDVLRLKYGRNNAKESDETGETAQVAQVATSGSLVSTALSSLKATGTKSLFNRTNADSSDEKAATVTVDNAKADPKKLTSTTISIQQIAKEQINGGADLKSAGKAVDAGLYSFDIQAGSKKATINVNVSLSDNNESIQKKMAQAINDRKLGVTASVSYDAKNKTSTLNVASATTGNKNPGDPVFSIQDTGDGDLAKKIGITEVSQEAQNAMYTINNGEKQYSNTNKIEIATGVTATLKEGGKSTTIDFKKDTSQSVAKVKELVGALNTAFANAASGSGRGSERLTDDLFNMNMSYNKTLSNIGINIKEDGTLAVDDKKLQKAAESGALEKVFQTDKYIGFANRADHIASNMNSSNYYADPVKKSTTSNASSFTGYGSLYDSMF